VEEAAEKPKAKRASKAKAVEKDETEEQKSQDEVS
jgi:hypothetical protein